MTQGRKKLKKEINKMEYVKILEIKKNTLGEVIYISKFKTYRNPNKYTRIENYYLDTTNLKANKVSKVSILLSNNECSELQKALSNFY